MAICQNFVKHLVYLLNFEYLLFIKNNVIIYYIQEHLNIGTYFKINDLIYHIMVYEYNELNYLIIDQTNLLRRNLI